MCAQWNKNNPDYFKANYLQKKLEGVPESSCKEFSSQGCAITLPQSRLKLELPHQVIQEVIGIQQLVIIEYLVQVLFQRFQEEIKKQIIENTG
jgi:hypothetical protein